MIVIPFQLNDREYSVFVMLQDDNLERIRIYDPAEVQINKLGERFQKLKLKDVIIGYGTDDDQRKVLELCGAGQPREALKYLSRGFAFRPDQGDHDFGPLSLKTKPGEKPS